MFKFYVLLVLLFGADGAVLYTNPGHSVTLPCFYGASVKYLCWYKQVAGEQPHIISSVYKHSPDSNSFHNQFKHDKRFSVHAGEGFYHLNISNVQDSDSAMYYCGKIIIVVPEFENAIFLDLKQSGRSSFPLQPVFDTMKPGGSVTPNCTVHADVGEKHEDTSSVLVLYVAAALLVSVTVNIVLISILCKMSRRTYLHSGETPARCQAPSTAIAESYLHYAALSVKLTKRSRKHRDQIWSWISVSGSESQTVEVQPGEDVTLLCSDISTSPTQVDWFRVTNRAKPSCISSMYGSDKDASFCDGFQNGKFKMSSNVSTVFLQIKGVDVSDSGMYFCGLYIGTHTVISTATHLNVKGDDEYEDQVECVTEDISLSCPSDPIAMSVILGGLTAVLTIVIIVLAVKIRKLQTAVKEEAQPERNKNLGSDQLDSAVLKFLPQTIRNRRSASERQVETHVIYAASR
ncbi:uncharacterized protein LOC127349534 isoform X3 [Dicentrarchus labrax]|uniref:uncharacterized protein LOC127349534 isoform X2 n=1 Tax=Dicentrarchus labrax TaxID=13489 RepID=UPI0021F5ADCD|nr:uncharacterized protein LOC127349534 isoform X2 [Dicentrarchus labrax]XP_051231310.1 uncharacterized protein LOC127349534 isoform X3 [Dicentrarchus labrax]